MRRREEAGGHNGYLLCKLLSLSAVRTQLSSKTPVSHFFFCQDRRLGQSSGLAQVHADPDAHHR